MHGDMANHDDTIVEVASPNADGLIPLGIMNTKQALCGRFAAQLIYFEARRPGSFRTEADVCLRAHGSLL